MDKIFSGQDKKLPGKWIGTDAERIACTEMIVGDVWEVENNTTATIDAYYRYSSRGWREIG